MTATILLYSALICFQAPQQSQQHCYPVLVGRSTPIGVFPVVHKLTKSPGYGGDILEFYEGKTIVYAIHRLWLRNPAQHRPERLASSDPAQRRNVTMGCVNVAPEVYEELLKDSLTQVEIVNK
jgi:hypothetical protein